MTTLGTRLPVARYGRLQAAVRSADNWRA